MGIKSITSGGVSTPEALLSAFRGFITDTTNGWTEEAYAVEDTTGYRLAIQSPSGDQFCFAAFDAISSVYHVAGATGSNFFVEGWGMNAFNGTYDAGEFWHRQAGKPRISSNDWTYPALMNFTNVANYWFYCYENPDFCVVVVEDSDGNFWSMRFGGLLESYGAITGGQVMGGTLSATDSFDSDGLDGMIWGGSDNRSADKVRATVGAVSNEWWGMNATAAQNEGLGWRTFNDAAYNATPNDWSGLPIMFICDIYAMSSATDYDPLGELSYIRVLNIESLVEAQLVTIGNESWRVFPNYAKGSDESANNGFAVLESVS